MIAKIICWFGTMICFFTSIIYFNGMSMSNSFWVVPLGILAYYFLMVIISRFLPIVMILMWTIFPSVLGVISCLLFVAADSPKFPSTISLFFVVGLWLFNERKLNEH